METIDFVIGYLAGFAVMYIVAFSIRVTWKKDLEKLKDFNTWKEWKNKNI